MPNGTAPAPAGDWADDWADDWAGPPGVPGWSWCRLGSSSGPWPAEPFVAPRAGADAACAPCSGRSGRSCRPGALPWERRSAPEMRTPGAWPSSVNPEPDPWPASSPGMAGIEEIDGTAGTRGARHVRARPRRHERLGRSWAGRAAQAAP